MTHFQILLIALVLDYFIGDPHSIWARFPHPAVLMGRLVTWFDDRLNKGAGLMAKGIVAIALLSIAAFAVGLAIRWLPDFGILELIIVTILLAHNSLVQHVKDVATGLSQSLPLGRAAVGRIVGRDTASLDQSGVSRAAVESAAENFSDAVIAPVFWYFFLGLPGLLLYKMVNTADSMIGHRTDRYLKFGFGAAKLDDILNWIPARLCGSLMCLVYRSRDSFELMRTDAGLHSSPNAGWPESAMAAILDVSLSGPRMYQGKLTDDAYINPRGRREMTPDDITGAIAVLNRSWLALAGFIAFIVFLIWLF
jgi:adenosylcobinamide-phosphate synthase